MLANLRALFGSVVDIILFRRGPEVLPASPALLAIAVASSVLVLVIMATVSSLPTGGILLEALVGTAVMLLWFRVALAVANKGERFLQTMTAIFSVNTLFLPAMVPLFAALLPYIQKADPANPPPAALFLIAMSLGLWGLIVAIRIVKSAFECPWLGAVLLVIGEISVSNLVGILIFGSRAPAAA